LSTPYSEIFELFLFNIQDYNIDEIYNTSEEDFETYVTNFLLKAIPEFSNCQNDLTNPGSKNYFAPVFNQNLGRIYCFDTGITITP
jgi:hypothetical protein